MLDSKLLSTSWKTMPRPVPDALLERPRLIDRLNESAAVTLVTAPAGFGKSILVTQWAQRVSLSVNWLSLQTDDNDAGWLERRIDAVLEDSPACLVLDNAGVLTSAASLAVLDRLVNDSGTLLRLVIVGRRPARLRLSRLRAMRQVAEIEVDDLRFTLGEACALLEDRNPTRLTREQIRSLWRVTRGWPTGLMLAVTADETCSSISGFAGDEWKKWDDLLDAYYREEVLERLPEDVQTFLFTNADLPMLTGDLCDFASGDSSGSAGLARLLEQAPDVLIRLPGDDRYLFKPLFSVPLRRLAVASGVKSVDRRPVVEWVHETGDLRAAAGLALQAGERPWIERTIQRLGEYLVRHSLFDQLILWMSRVPDDVVSLHPGFQYWRIVARLGLGRTFEAGQMVDDAAPGWIATGDPLHVGRVSLLQGMLAYWEGRGSAASSHLALALEYLPPQAEMERLYAETFLGNQAFREGRDDDAAVPLRAAELKLRRQTIQVHWGGGPLPPIVPMPMPFVATSIRPPPSTG
jgi:LuxR family maltose regulon positive regulatory protein